MSQRYRILFLSLMVLAIAAFSTAAFADPCLTVYPTGPTVYHYDMSEYYVVGPGDPLYDPMYDRGGYCLIDSNTMDIDMSIYQAPNLVGFTPSTDGMDGYFFEGYSFQLVIDGFSNTPTSYDNIILVINPLPASCPPMVTIDGNLVTGGTYPLGSLVVSTPTAEGHNYSDTMVLDVTWAECAQMQFWAYDDENYNGMKDGGECFSAFSHDTTVPSARVSIGTIKAQFGGSGQ
ncbi:MAG TPA: hypothetical protein VKA63_08615 [Candidatus Krumholzibacteria bacterium]|nr:hypothetical protein [Candidatus Krumholzibacteria bacterium]